MIIVLKVSRKPDNFDEDLELRVQESLYYIAFVHVIFAIWIYGSTDIFQSDPSSEISGISSLTSFLASATTTTSSNRWVPSFFSRAGLVQNYVLDVLGAIIVLIFLVK